MYLVIWPTSYGQLSGNAPRPTIRKADGHHRAGVRRRQARSSARMRSPHHGGPSGGERGSSEVRQYTSRTAVGQLSGSGPWSFPATRASRAFTGRASRELGRLDVPHDEVAVASAERHKVLEDELMVTANVALTFPITFILLPKFKATAVSPHLIFVTSDTHHLVDLAERDAPEGIFNRLNDRNKSLTNESERYPATKLMQDGCICILSAGLCKTQLSRDLETVMVRMVKGPCSSGTRSKKRGRAQRGYLNRGRLTTPATVVVGTGGAETQKRLYIELMGRLDIVVRVGRFCESVSGVFCDCHLLHHLVPPSTLLTVSKFGTLSWPRRCLEVLM
ncbi:Short chain dehydrogenase [Apiospora phragmitis]|uniref:Short chain dehydrogenase n=1 Tax=Apiospora phragmitis TaxID=2905665 RepID=A0ABR1URQ1_9PEZI